MPSGLGQARRTRKARNSLFTREQAGETARNIFARLQKASVFGGKSGRESSVALLSKSIAESSNGVDTEVSHDRVCFPPLVLGKRERAILENEWMMLAI